MVKMLLKGGIDDNVSGEMGRRKESKTRTIIGRNWVDSREKNIPTGFRREVWAHTLGYQLPPRSSFRVDETQEQFTLRRGVPRAGHDAAGRSE